MYYALYHEQGNGAKKGGKTTNTTSTQLALMKVILECLTGRERRKEGEVMIMYMQERTGRYRRNFGDGMILNFNRMLPPARKSLTMGSIGSTSTYKNPSLYGSHAKIRPRASRQSDGDARHSESVISLVTITFIR